MLILNGELCILLCVKNVREQIFIFSQTITSTIILSFVAFDFRHTPICARTEVI